MELTTDRVEVMVRACRDDEVHETLLQLVRDVAASSPGGGSRLNSRLLRLGHSCAECGSDNHGRPVLLGIAGTAHVSLSRCRPLGLGLVALCNEATVGIDVEQRGRLDNRTASQFFHEPEPGTHRDPTRQWTRAEAVLKAMGRGLSVDPRNLDLTSGLVTTPRGEFRVVELAVPVDERAVASICVGSAQPISVRWL